jgi:hypothetical protein
MAYFAPYETTGKKGYAPSKATRKPNLEYQAFTAFFWVHMRNIGSMATLSDLKIKALIKAGKPFEGIRHYQKVV